MLHAAMDTETAFLIEAIVIKINLSIAIDAFTFLIEGQPSTQINAHHVRLYFICVVTSHVIMVQIYTVIQGYCKTLRADRQSARDSLFLLLPCHRPRARDLKWIIVCDASDDKRFKAGC